MPQIPSYNQQTTIDDSDKFLLADGATGETKYADMSTMKTKILSAGSTAWASWTPTLTNMSGGTLRGNVTKSIGKLTFFRFGYLLAGANITGSVTFTLPVTAKSTYTAGDSLIGLVQYTDNGAAAYRGVVRLETTTTGLLAIETVSGTYPTLGVLSATVPFTWGANDFLSVQGFYEAA